MAKNKTAGLSEHLADKLLELLGDSDKFRDLFQEDPRAALEQIGYKASDEKRGAASPDTPATSQLSLAGCIGVQQLASKDSIRSAQSELKTMLLRGLSQTSPGLDAAYKPE